MEEGTRSHKPAAQTSSGRAMVARHHKLPWIPNEEDWHSILAAARQESTRNRTMLAFAYDAGLRREELCSLQSSDMDPSRRLLKIRAESTKGRRERALPYSASSGELLVRYLGRSFSPSHALTTAIPFRYGVGRRSYSRLHAELASNASQRTHFAISV
nr:site-specific integrase [Acidisarcina polymorpha]